MPWAHSSPPWEILKIKAITARDEIWSWQSAWFLFKQWADSSNLSFHVAINRFIISCCDLLDSWASDFPYLWPSGHSHVDSLNFTSLQYTSAKLNVPEHTISISIIWPQWVENEHRGQSSDVSWCWSQPGETSVSNREFDIYIYLPAFIFPTVPRLHWRYEYMIHLFTSSSLHLCPVYGVWALYRSATCCTVLWVNAALLKSSPCSQFAPSRQSVLSPRCAVLSGVSRTMIWLHSWSSTSLGI